MNLLQVHLSKGAQTAFQRLFCKAENTFGFPDALVERSPKSCISEDQSGFCHNITCPQKLMTEAANNSADFSSTSLILESRLVWFFCSDKEWCGKQALFILPRHCQRADVD